MFEFNQRGLLVPNSIVEASLPEVEDVFVLRIGTEKRRILYNNYLSYLAALEQLVGLTPFKQWINGSFSTLEPNPSDIDIVSFINFEVVEQFDKALKPLRYPASLKLGIDAYIVRVYPSEHRLFPLYEGDRAYWLDRFSKTERNRRGVIYPKGFVELTFSVS